MELDDKQSAIGALDLIEFHQYQVDIYEDIFKWDAESEKKIEFNEDETEFNTNVRRRFRMDDDFLNSSRKELEYHKHELKKYKERLRVYMKKFNGVWSFE